MRVVIDTNVLVYDTFEAFLESCVEHAWNCKEESHREVIPR